MFRLLHRYVLREFLAPFCVGLMVFTFVLILHQLFLMMDLFLNRGVDITIIVRLAGLILPMSLPLSIPMAALFGALIAYGHMSEDGELTALRSSGCSHAQYTWPALFLCFLSSIFLTYFNLSLAPRATQNFRNLYHMVAKQNQLALFAPRVMNHFGDYKVIVDKMDRKKKVLTGISIYHMNPEGAPTRILAPLGEISSNPDKDIILSLINGSVHQPNPEKFNEYTITKFNRYALRIPVTMDLEKRVPTPRELTFSELQDAIRAQREHNTSPAPYQTERDMRVAIAFAPVFFVFLGAVLGIRLRKGSKAVGIGMSVVVILSYFGLLVLMVPLSSEGLGNSTLLTWIPNLAAGGAGAALWSKLARQ